MNPFRSLGADRVLALTERELGRRADSVCHPLTSYINRVFDVPMADGDAVVVKFFRPGRWSVEALEEEQDFVFALEAEDVPVVAPICNREGFSLFEDQGIWFCIMPRKRGRPFEDPDPATWRELGRTLARMHIVGDDLIPEERLVWSPETATLTHLDFILDHSQNAPADLIDDYADLVEELVDSLSPLFEDRDYTRIHGDMHVANLMKRPDEDGIFLIDFDDMVYGPPVQDLWMLLPDTVPNSRPELEHLLYGYRQIRDFAENDLDLVEPLRAMRFVHFTAWCALQQADGGPNRLAAHFGTEAWWRGELSALQDQRARIRETLRI
ncbi:MAG: serine/threonine protein kinase [Verrucomicrobia bacterium]|nr:serine/threonine protein kinase [Verrucomicrobiota bacterium]MCH8526561.1 serine/threonine protein kinase [Kiritimatiellia bacterium]